MCLICGNYRSTVFRWAIRHTVFPGSDARQTDGLLQQSDSSIRSPASSSRSKISMCTISDFPFDDVNLTMSARVSCRSDFQIDPSNSSPARPRQRICCPDCRGRTRLTAMKMRRFTFSACTERRSNWSVHRTTWYAELMSSRHHLPSLARH